MVFYNNYIDYCNKVNKSPSAVAEELGFKRSVVTAWKGGRKPRQATLQKIANYFGCSVEDLLEEKEITPPKKDGMTIEQIKIALFGCDAGDILDEDLDNAVQFALFSARERKKKSVNE